MHPWVSIIFVVALINFFPLILTIISLHSLNKICITTIDKSFIHFQLASNPLVYNKNEG